MRGNNNAIDVLLPKVFSEARFKINEIGRNRRSLSHSNLKDYSRLNNRVVKTREAGITVNNLPFRIDGHVIHTYALPSRIVKEFKEEFPKIPEKFENQMDKIFKRFDEPELSYQAVQQSRVGFRGWQRSEVFVRLTKNFNRRKKIIKK